MSVPDKVADNPQSANGDVQLDPALTATGGQALEEVADPRWFTNRELSWIDFDARVLELAQDDKVRLLERAKFAAIFASNLDEFYMIRVAGLHAKVEAQNVRRGPDGRTADETIDAIRERLQPLLDQHSSLISQELLPKLAEEGITVARFSELAEPDQKELADRFERRIFPVLTPLAVGQGRPFPYISNLSLNLGVLVRDPETRETAFARIKLPTEVLDRFERLRGETASDDLYVPLEEIVGSHLGRLFPGMEILDHGMFRVTRDADFDISDDEDDVMRALQAELRNRRFGEIVRLEIDADMSDALQTEIVEQLEVQERQVYRIDGMLDATALFELVKAPGHNDLLEQPWRPVTRPALRSGDDEQPDVFAAMRRGDVLVHHPYDSFHTSVERFVEQAVADRDVLALKMTLYRTNSDSSLLPALARAAERGKQTVALVELKARFDEQANIRWAQILEDTGAHVVYGHPALKTHAKCILVVRREGDGVRHYVHIGTGNYHAKTARLYTDFGLFTCDPKITADVTEMFNNLTGFARQDHYRKVLVSPQGVREGLLEELERTVEAHKAGIKTRVRIKCNSIVDKLSIHALYAASQAGVPIEINVRGICSLRPGVAGLSETISVRSVLGQFLEHSRVFSFERGEETSLFMGSADIMERNLDNRVELVVPVENSVARDEIVDSLDRAFADETGAWTLDSEGVWQRVRPIDPKKPRSLHQELLELHAQRAREADLAD